MKTAIAFVQTFSREFSIRGGLVQFRPPPPLEGPLVPLVLKATSSYAPLSATLEVFAELIHGGEDDPIGYDRLYAQCALHLHRVFIENPAKRHLSRICHSTREIDEWLSTVKQAFLAGNDFSVISRSLDGKVMLVFSPLFDGLAKLHTLLRFELLVRATAWKKHTWTSLAPSHLKRRFLLDFS